MCESGPAELMTPLKRIREKSTNRVSYVAKLMDQTFTYCLDDKSDVVPPLA